jgi:polyvinyl alcohol dehydrogenase (cytochrome)
VRLRWRPTFSVTFASGASAATACSAAPAAGGEWPVYGGNLADTRSQPAEHVIGAGNAKNLKPAWVFKTSSVGDPTAFQTNPVIDGGCAYIGSAAGQVYAVDMSNGNLVWKRKLTVPHPGLGAAIVGAAAVDGNEVIVLANELGGPYAVALDRSTGAVLWQSAPYTTVAANYTNASPVVANGLVAAGFSPPEGDGNGQGGFALIDASTGQIVKVTPTISPADQAKGFAGGGLWSTPAYDASTGYLYWGAGNPDSKAVQDIHTDAILKIDLNRSDSTFGEIVASYKGNVDGYSNLLDSLSHTALCALSASIGLPYPPDDPLCGQLDLDFGASAQLFHVGSTEVVGDLQKSGVYHVANAATMAPVWTQLIGLSCQFCNAAGTAVDGSSVFGVGTPGGIMYSLNQGTGKIGWQSPVLDGIHYQPTSVAGGVVYTIDGNGFLDAFDEANGQALLRHQTSLDTGGC